MSVDEAPDLSAVLAPQAPADSRVGLFLLALALELISDTRSALLRVNAAAKVQGGREPMADLAPCECCC